MGQALPTAVLTTIVERDGNETFRVGTAETNGWRNSMEDAHVIEMRKDWGPVLLSPLTFYCRPSREPSAPNAWRLESLPPNSLFCPNPNAAGCAPSGSSASSTATEDKPAPNGAQMSCTSGCRRRDAPRTTLRQRNSS